MSFVSNIVTRLNASFIIVEFVFASGKALGDAGFSWTTNDTLPGLSAKTESLHFSGANMIFPQDRQMDGWMESFGARFMLLLDPSRRYSIDLQLGEIGMELDDVGHNMWQHITYLGT
jgi:hypothetical protein